VLLGLIGLAAAGGLGYYARGLYLQVAALDRSLEQSVVDKRLCGENLQREQHHAGDLEKRLAGCTTASSSLETNLNASRAELDDLRKQRAQTEARLQAFRDLTEKFRKMIDTGQIKVLIRDGRMIMKLPEHILFPSGKAELSDKGKAALKEVAENLKTLPERNFMVAGHTDDVALAKSSPYHSNWELSTARAVLVTEFLIDAGMRPQQLVAAGYSQYDPVSKTHKQENRRIEIVLLPSIDELPRFPAELTQTGNDDEDEPASKKTQGK
jgi:chemotaxis protein MotB